MRIPIPEIDKRFDSTEDALAYIIRICNVFIDKARVTHPYPSIMDISGYLLEFCRKVLIQFSTLEKVAREREDYNTVCSLVRILADNLSTIRLVYGGNDDEERVLRHYLYVLDGVSARNTLLKSHPVVYQSNVSIETLKTLSEQVQSAQDNAEKCIDICITAIQSCPRYKEQQQNIDVLIENKNWKYKSIQRPYPYSKNVYSWKEMYALLGIREATEIFPFLSQYVHGLSVSNIGLCGDKDDFDAPLSFAMVLLGWLFFFLKKTFEPDLHSFTWEDIYRMAPELFNTII